VTSFVLFTLSTYFKSVSINKSKSYFSHVIKLYCIVMGVNLLL